MEREPSWREQLLIGLGALLVIGALLGAIFAVVAVKAADYVGLGEDRTTSTPGPILPSTADATKTAPPTTPTNSAPTSTRPSHHRPPPQRSITLSASPLTVGTFGKINLSGTYLGHDGATLQVQRALGDGPWGDFPIDTSVSGGRFGTYIQTSMQGLNHIRMLDKATGQMSNVVTVRVG